MLANSKNISLLIQGPVAFSNNKFDQNKTITWARHLDKYLEYFDEIIISTYEIVHCPECGAHKDDGPCEHIEEAPHNFIKNNILKKQLGYEEGDSIYKLYEEKVKIILSPGLPNSIDEVNGKTRFVSEYLNYFTTFHYALYTMSNGFKEVSNPYVVKMRSDECYSDFSRLIEVFNENPDKFVCGNIFCKPTWPFIGDDDAWKIKRNHGIHIGDHVFMAKTKHLYAATNNLFALYDNDTDIYDTDTFTSKEEVDKFKNQTWHKFIDRNRDPSSPSILHPKDKLCPETILYCSWLWAQGITQEEWSTWNEYEHPFKVVDINSMGKYIARWGSGDLTFSSEKEMFFWARWSRT